MALPTLLQQTAITNEKEALNLLREQKDIMKKLSDSIISNQREYGSLKKDMVDLKKEFVLGMSGISEISKYFAEMKSDKVKERRMESKGNTSTNIFSSLIAKLVGKKDSVANKDFIELQTRLLEETKILKSLALDNMENIRFIKKSYEDKEKAKERKLLAEAIAEAIGSDNKGGFLKGIVGPLLAGFGIALATAASAIGSLVSGAITAGLATISSLLAKNALTPDIDINRRGGPVAAPVPTGPGADVDADKTKGKDKPKTTTKQKISAGAGLLGRIGAIALPAGILAMLMSAEETQYGTGENENASTPEEVGGNPSAIGLPQAMAKVEAEKKAKALEDERNKKLAAMPDESDAETRRLMRQSEQVEQAASASMDSVIEKTEETKGKTEDIYSMMTAKMKDFISSLGVDTEGLGKSAVDMLNNLGTIDFGEGKQINLLPDLGSRAAGIIEELQGSLASAKDVVAGGGSTQYNSVQNTSIGGSTMTVPADSSTIDTDPGILRYLKR
jgi:hypothetical protein